MCSLWYGLPEMYSSLIPTDVVRRLPRLQFRFIGSGFSIGVSLGYSDSSHAYPTGLISASV